MQPLLRFLVVDTILAGLVFALLSGVFARWEGHVVSHRPAVGEDPAVLTVLIVTDDGVGTEADWPADVVRPLGLPVDPTGTPPNRIPDDAAYTLKTFGSTSFALSRGDGATRTIQLTSARAVGGAVLAWVVGLALFNMWRSGSPFSWEPRAAALPAHQQPSGQAAPPPAAARSRKGPPPAKRRRGQGRRR